MLAGILIALLASLAVLFFSMVHFRAEGKVRFRWKMGLDRIVTHTKDTQFIVFVLLLGIILIYSYFFSWLFLNLFFMVYFLFSTLTYMFKPEIPCAVTDKGIVIGMAFHPFSEFSKAKLSGEAIELFGKEMLDKTFPLVIIPPKKDRERAFAFVRARIK